LRVLVRSSANDGSATYYQSNGLPPSDPGGPYFPASQPNPSVTNLGDTVDPAWQGGPTGVPGVRTRDFEQTWDTTPSVMGPMGKMNPGYTHNVVSDNGQWSRGELPDTGYGYTFALRRPRLMREPGTNLGTVNLANG
jgi:hypothetical protein